MSKQLIILPFDHRSSFLKDITNQKRKVREMKEMIFDAFLLSIKNKRDFAILVDEELGENVLLRAKKENIKICLPVEKSGQKELKLEYGDDFQKHIKKFDPEYVKILVRYNPSNIEINKRQLEVLSKIGNFCRENKYKVLLELLVPKSKEEIDIKNYDTLLRYKKTIEAIKEIKAKIKVSVWKLEGFSKKQWENVIKSTNKGSKIVLLGRGEDKSKVSKWMRDASGYKEIIGFAIGRTIFLEPLKEYQNNKSTKEETIKKISDNFNYFINLWTTLKRKKL
ncbi:MAG: 2-deoxy-5-keto-D-gluconate 6-phosphate aldolase domain-containing protein [Minisyncoccales bacterium]|jgi:myo-inositol catabolism protein IolC